MARRPRPASYQRLMPLAISTFGSVGAGVGGQASLLVSGIIVARLLGVEGRGQLALFSVVSSILIQLGGLGLPTAVTYFVARNTEQARTLIRKLALPIAGQILLLMVLNETIILFLFRGESQAILAAAAFSALMVPISLMQSYGFALLQGSGRFASFSAVRLVSPGTYGLFALVLFLIGSKSLFLVVGIWMGSSACSMVAAFYLAHRALPRGGISSDPVEVMPIVRFGLRSTLGTSSPLETFRIDQAIAGLALSPASLGLYVVGTSFSNLPRILASSVGMIAYPHIASSANEAHARRMTWRFLGATLLMCGAFVIALQAVLGWLVPFFFGQEFAGAVMVSRILLVGAFFFAGRRILSDCARGAGLPGLSSVAEVISWVVLLPAMAVFTPLWGVNGVALALAVSAAAAFFVLLYLVVRTPTAEVSRSASTSSLEMAA